MATTDKQKEDGKPKKKCHRRNLQIEEFPTFTKWLGPRGRSSSRDDTSSKSYKRGVPYPPVRRIPRDSSSGGGGVVACDVSKEDGGVAIGESISARGGCCCWQRSKSTQRECGLNFHFSLRKSKVVTNVSEGVAAGVSDVREEQVVEAGAVINREGCGCRCSPTFHICGRRKVPPTGVSYLPEKRSGRRKSRSIRRRGLPVVDAPNLHKEEGPATDGPDVLKEEVATSCPDLVKEGEAIAAPGPCKEGSRSCCSQWKCLPSFPMCGRKLSVVEEEVTIEEEVSVYDPNGPEVEEVANGPESVKEGEATIAPAPCKEGSESCSQWKCSPSIPMCERKVATGEEELTVVNVPNLLDVEVANGPELVQEGEATDAPSLCKRSGSCCSQWKCLPAFPMCGRKVATSKEELTDVDVPNLLEVEEVANGPELVKEGEATVAPGPCKEESGYCFPQWKCLPSFPTCGRKLSVVEEEVTVDDPNVPEVANRPDLAKEGEATVAPDPRKEGSGCCSPRLKDVSEFQIRNSKVAAGKQEMTVDVPNVLEVEEVANDVVNKQDDICPEKQEVIGLPGFQICSSKVAAGKQEMTIDVPNVPEVEEVANDVVKKQKKEVDGDPNTGEAVASCSSSSNLHEEEEKINASVPELHKNGSGCGWFKWMPSFLICGSKVVSDVPNPSREEKVVAGDSDIQEGVGAAAVAVAAAADSDADWEAQSKSARQGSCWPFQCCTIWWPSKLLCTGGMDVNASNHQEEEQEEPLSDNKEKVVDVLTVKHNEKGAAMGVPDLHEEDGTVADKQVAVVDIPVPRKEEKESAGDTLDLIQKEKKASSGKEEEENVGSVVSDSGKEEGGCCCSFKHGGKEDGCSRRGSGSGRHRRQSSNSREGCWPFQICGKGWLGLPTFLICGRRKKLSDSIASAGNGVSVSDISNVVVAVAGTSSVLAVAGTSGILATINSSKSMPMPMPGCGCWYSKPPRRRSVSIDKEEGDSRCSKSSKRRRGGSRRSGRKEKEGKERKR
ncbi:uncharacterized protein LOC111430613 isoform X2 [Cucurbita moschata]|uniref:Uncharacterized protein LOC111430613 isoform X2 n=1 Tax=Cucurbita moschata TaxID=3662 RepID=A0A6J1E7K5_CUCMO|nr:uncharacterized protein LOC111430613 isoform X2 [Cucurbita moschata]